MTATAHNWPARDEYEEGERNSAIYLMEHAESDGYNPQHTDAERQEVDALQPLIVAMIRTACGRIERPLRRDHPEAAALARGQHPNGNRRWYADSEMIDGFHSAVAGLAGPDREVYDDLGKLRDVRSELKHRDFYGPRGNRRGEYRWAWCWPSRYPRPTSPELDRLDVINAEMVERYRAEMRARGRKMIADLESGAAWERELRHRAVIEEWKRNGPLINHR